MGKRLVSEPALSIIVLTYNRRRMLLRCLESCLSQDSPSDYFEIIVSDDGSNDGTQEALKDLSLKHGQIRFVSQPHRGIASARNCGLTLAQGKLIAFVADDYLLPKNYVSTIKMYFDENPSARIVRFTLEPVDLNFVSKVAHYDYEVLFRARLYPLGKANISSSRPWQHTFRKLPELPAKGTMVSGTIEAAGAACFRRQIFEEVGVFDEALKRTEDSEFTSRLQLTNQKIHVLFSPKIAHDYGDSLAHYFSIAYLSGQSSFHLLTRQAPPRTAWGQLKASAVSQFSLFINAKSPVEFFILAPMASLLSLTRAVGFFVQRLKHEAVKGRALRR